MLKRQHVYTAPLPGDSEPMTAVLRLPSADEETKFIKKLRATEQKGQKIKLLDFQLEARCEFFDLLVQDISGTYEDDSGNPVAFSNANPIPASVIKELAALKRLNVENPTVKDILPKRWKEQCIMKCLEWVDDEDDDLKKNA